MGYQIVVYNFARLQADEIAEIFPDKKLNEMDLIDYFEDNLKLVIDMEIEKLKNMGVNIISNTDETIIILKPTFEIDTTSLSKAFYHIKDCDVNGSLIIKQDITENKKYQAGKKKRLLWLINELKSRNIHCKGNTKWNNDILLYSCPLCNKDNEKMYMFINSFHSGTQSKTDCIDQKHQDYFKDLQKELLIKWKSEQNPDKLTVKWHPDYVDVTFKNEDDEKETTTLTEYNDRYADGIAQPKISKFVPLTVIENVKALLKHYDTTIKYNEVLMRFEIYKNDKIISSNLEEYLIYLRDLGSKKKFNMYKERWYDAVLAIAKEQTYNPIEDYLKDCRNYFLSNPDMEILKKLQSTIISSSEMKDDYIKKFLLQMVYLICSKQDDDTSGQFVLVLQSNQHGIGKTTWLRHLIPKKFRVNYFLEGKSLDLNNKDAILETMTNWLVELGEIASTFRKSDQEGLKNFITLSKDKVRPPYFKSSIENKRRTSLCGSTNDTEYLRDVTGSRRFLTIECEGVNAYHNLDMDMLWGFMYDLYLRNEPYYYDLDNIKIIEQHNQKYTFKSESQLLLEDTFILKPANNKDGKWLTANEIYEALEPGQFIIPNKFKLGRELKRFGVAAKKTNKSTLYYVKYIDEKLNGKSTL